MSRLSATISRLNQEHYEVISGIGPPISASSQLIPPSKPVPAERCEGIDRYHRPIASPPRFWLTRNRERGRYEHQANRKSGLRRQSAQHGRLRLATPIGTRSDRGFPFRRFNK